MGWLGNAFDIRFKMSGTMEPEYMGQIRLLEDVVDIDRAYLSYEVTLGVIWEFFTEVVLETSHLNKLNIGEEAHIRSKAYASSFRDYHNRNISEENLRAIRVDAWRDFERFQGADKKLIRLILCCLVVKRDYLLSVDTDMQDNYFVLIAVLAFELDEQLAGVFTRFIEKHLSMQDFRRPTRKVEDEPEEE